MYNLDGMMKEGLLDDSHKRRRCLKMKKSLSPMMNNKARSWSVRER